MFLDMLTAFVIGEYTVPQYRLATLLDQTKKVYNKIREGKNVDTTNLLEALGFKATSQSYYRNRKELEMFGLVAGKAPNVKVTPLALRAIGEDTAEKQAALEEVFDNFELWKKLRERKQDFVDKESFWQALVAITGDHSRDNKTFEKFRKAYIDDLHVLAQSETKPNNQDETSSVSEETDRLKSEVAVSTAPKKTIGSITYPEYSESPIQIKDELSYEIAQKLLNAIGEQLGIEKKPVQTLLHT
jgi:hypothetical protein